MIILFGPAGSGKSTQGQMLATRHGLTWISTGELFRQTKDPEILSILKSGQLVSDDIVNKMVFAKLAEIGTDKVILDGYPRNLDQAKTLVGKLGTDKINVVTVLDMTEEEIMNRLALRGRMEDDADTIRKRLAQYNETTNQILDYLTSEGVSIEHVNGVGEVGVIHDQVEAAIEKHGIGRF
ncbi:adenylate kinase [Alphaproteobacteria bacterium]|nr:adenylate kinase [Alphaproteobacteria bacterium]